MEEAHDLENTVKQSGRIFALTHNYTGYPMVKQAKRMIQDGKFGEIRKLVVEYPSRLAFWKKKALPILILNKPPGAQILLVPV